NTLRATSTEDFMEFPLRIAVLASLQNDPRRSMVARPFAPPVLAVDARLPQPGFESGAQQEEVHSKPGVALECVRVDPEGVDPLVRVHPARGVDPSLGEQPPPGIAGFRLHHGVLPPPPWIVDVGIRGYDVEVSGEHDRP